MNACWLTIITMTTVGYGDIYPKTFFGRFFGVISFIVGNVLMSLIVVVLNNETIFEPAEAKAYNTLKKSVA
jgi:predicted lipid-binding transport protein (Tim44 family)